MDDSRRRVLLDCFWMPSVQTMVSRKSSITNAFVNAVIPTVEPTPEEIEEALSILGMKPSDLRCAYCGDKATEWDHLRPLVHKHRPTGYITEIGNLVPSCPKCNQSKGNSEWRKWILSMTAKHSPTKRGIPGIQVRMEHLEAYERWRPATKIDFEALLGREAWEDYWKLWEAVNAELKKCQDVADFLREKIKVAIRSK